MTSLTNQTKKKPLQVDHKYPMRGVHIWNNPKNGFTVFELHYTADEAKQSPEWKREASKGMPIRKWNQEYEIVWETWTGKPVYADFVKANHITKETISPHVGLPLLRGWDFGLTPAAIICQLQKNTLCVIHEFTAVNEGIETFSEKVLKQCKTLWPMWGDTMVDWLDFYDPAGNRANETNVVSCANVLKAKRLRCVPGAVAFEARRSAVEYYLTRSDRQGPWFKISEPHCPVLCAGFAGGYRYPDKIDGMAVDRIKPLKDHHSHPHDALQYLATGIRKGYNRKKRKIPLPHYGWTRA